MYACVYLSFNITIYILSLKMMCKITLLNVSTGGKYNKLHYSHLNWNRNIFHQNFGTIFYPCKPAKQHVKWPFNLVFIYPQTIICLNI